MSDSWKAVADDVLSVVRIYDANDQKCGDAAFVNADQSKRFAEQVNRGALLMDLSEEQINAIDWSKVPGLVEACKEFSDDWNGASAILPIQAALAAVERK